LHRQKLGNGRAEVKIIFQQREKEFLLQKKDFFDKLENNRDFTGEFLTYEKHNHSRQQREKISHKILKKNLVLWQK
jgi:hypothetical protein